MDRVILLHGIWMRPVIMLPLAARLRKAGFATHCFSYPSLKQSPASNARGLQNFVRNLQTERLHFVAHSLGGLVLLHYFHHFEPPQPGRVVMLGSPLGGSWSAQRLETFPMGKLALGKSIENGLHGDLPAWSSRREVGMIAGDHAIGIGRILGEFPGPNDGAVLVSETEAPWLTDHIVLPVTHSGMLLSSQVADQTAFFLKNGHFSLTSSR